MKILLAPSETKNSGGDSSFLSQECFKYKEFFPIQQKIIKEYEDYILNLDEKSLANWFGLKNINEAKKYQRNLRELPTLKAIQRYSGVAFDALDYESLESKDKEYIDENLLIFSNLFGVLSATDLIPEYKFKQASKLPNIDIEKFYNQNISKLLDEILGEEVIDLRAGYYEKFYKITKAKVLSFKFIKEGKVVSHWAKYYRGKLLQYLAKNRIKNFSEFMLLEFEDLKLIEVQEKKNIKLLTMQIL